MDLKLQTSDYDGEGPFFYHAMAGTHWTPKGQPLYVI